jgi:asparagine synthase (glutamine-hydrolysing)
MCGIVGILDTNKKTTHADVSAMSGMCAHRGPDDSGFWQNEEGTVLFGFRRLAFFDITSAGHQPMHSDGLSIVFNGEIYNHRDIRSELEACGHTFVSTSDTEVILHAWREWGHDAVARFRGMFAFVLYDERSGEMHVYRDRFGVKPLYYYHKDGLFACASEIKALLEHPRIGQDRAIDPEGLPLFLQLSYVPAPWSIFKDIRKLEAGHSMTLNAQGALEKRRYWDIEDFYAPASGPHDVEVATKLDRLCGEAFSLRMLSDRPVGMFLSGGVDSSAVAGVLTHHGYTNLETFTIGFAETEHDEADHARKVAAHLGTVHRELRCTPEEARAIIPKLSDVYDEPFGDASAIPTYLVSQFARTHVVASLSADGGDEVFGGYRSYASTLSFVRKARWISYVGGAWTLAALTAFISACARLHLLPQRAVHKFKKAQQLYPVRNDLPRLFARIQSHFGFDEVQSLLAQGSSVSAEDVFARHAPKEAIGAQRTLQHLDLRLYMPDDILVKVDRATMAHSLEGREPLLDHRLVEYVAGLPEDQLIDPRAGKHLLREILYKYVPKELVDRPKQGFGVPLDAWLQGALRHLIDTYLDADRIKREGMFKPAAIEREKAAFFSGHRPYTRIWNLIMFEMWYERWMGQGR